MGDSSQASPADVIEFLRMLLAHPPGSSPEDGPAGDLPSRSLDRLRRTRAATDPAAPRRPRDPAMQDEIIDVEALRRAIGSADPVSVGSSHAAHEIPGHVEHAKRTYLAALIDEFGGDLSLISRFWDRTSPKTIRKLVTRYGLAAELEAARARGPRRLDGGVAPTSGPGRPDNDVDPTSGPRPGRAREVGESHARLDRGTPVKQSGA